MFKPIIYPTLIYRERYDQLHLLAAKSALSLCEAEAENMTEKEKRVFRTLFANRWSRGLQECKQTIEQLTNL
ncbi:MAG: hypothetical protein IPG59_00900 [Candidatus Melainabacteria bacterium]|nr:MAG: hypothetical protein IPG59_00900 [Candidatus Melainabacteria bacterium]